MAGTVTETRHNHATPQGKRIQKIVIDWVADASAATVPTQTISAVYGWVVKAVTIPGSTAPTANYTVKMIDVFGSSLDLLAGALGSRSATATEQAYPTVSGASVPVLAVGDYVFTLSGNSVNSATGKVVLYLMDDL